MFLLWVLVLIAFAMVLRLRTRVEELEGTVRRQQDEMRDFAERLGREPRKGAVPAETPPVAPAPPRPVPIADEEPRATVVPPPVPVFHTRAETPPPSEPEPLVPAPEPIAPAPPSSWTLPQISINWEELVGVKLFSAIAGIALVLAAVFFLRYSIEHGWLEPPVRVAIGIIVAIALLVVCELKAARKYAVTANALDAAAIAILFATFFAAHALWNLIPRRVDLRAARRSSPRSRCCCRSGATRCFIAVLGLLGGFATPALLSTGENRPIPLFAYLLLLNVGLAWVAFAQEVAAADDPHARPHDDLPVGLGVQVPRRPASCRWRWASSWSSRCRRSPALMLAARRGDDARWTLTLLERTGARARRRCRWCSPSTWPRFRRYGAHAGAAVRVPAPDRRRRCWRSSLGRREERSLHALGGAWRRCWCSRSGSPMSYASGAWITAMRVRGAVRASSTLLAPMVAARLVGRPFDRRRRGQRSTPRRCCCSSSRCSRASSPRRPRRGLLFGALFALLALIAWRALATGRVRPVLRRRVLRASPPRRRGRRRHLTPERLRAGARPLRRVRRLLSRRAARRRAASGADSSRRGAPAPCSSRACVLLLFLAAGARRGRRRSGGSRCCSRFSMPGLFIESAAGGLPVLSVVGGAAVVDRARRLVGPRRRRSSACCRRCSCVIGLDADHARRPRVGACADGAQRGRPTRDDEPLDSGTASTSRSSVTSSCSSSP